MKSFKSELRAQFIVDWNNIKDVSLNESEVDHSLNDYNKKFMLSI